MFSGSYYGVLNVYFIIKDSVIVMFCDRVFFLDFFVVVIMSLYIVIDVFFFFVVGD